MNYADLLRVQPTLEELLTSSHGFALTTASPLQRAICRLAQGRPLGELAEADEVRAAIGDADEKAPKELIILAAIRSAKSMLAAAIAWTSARGCDVSMLAHGEVPRVSVVSVYRDNARVVFEHLLGAISANPWMQALVLGEPRADSISVKHVTGREVEICVVAGSRAGTTLVSRWCAGCVFDEAPRMASADQHVINYEEQRRNVIGRLLPGALLVSVGSPWAPFGAIHDTVQQYWQKPDAPVRIIWAPGWAMNPVYWTKERVEELRATDQNAYLTDCAAQFASPEEALYASSEVEKCTRATGDLPYSDRSSYVAAMDPATRGNSWTLVIATKDGPTLRIAAARQWTGSKLEPLMPNDTMRQVAEVCRTFHVKYVLTDQWFGDALADIGRMHGLGVVQTRLAEGDRYKRYLNFKTRLSEGLVDLPPEPDLRGDLLRVKRTPTQQGGVKINLPHTSDGRHCDYAPAVMLALDEWLRDMDPEPLPEAEREEKKMKELILKRWQKSKRMR